MMAAAVEITEYDNPVEGTPDDTLYAAVCRWKRSTLAPECGWISYGWRSRVIAGERAQQHLAEHNNEGIMPELFEFRTGEKHPDWTEA